VVALHRPVRRPEQRAVAAFSTNDIAAIETADIGALKSTRSPP
jgi:hypothetical protein